jgi:tripartite-type tricarboxylate transporter receptor subunit TctC
LAIAAFEPVEANGQSLENFYRGTSFKLVVGSSPGGGYDTYARTLGQFISGHIPGSP